MANIGFTYCALDVGAPFVFKSVTNLLISDTCLLFFGQGHIQMFIINNINYTGLRVLASKRVLFSGCVPCQNQFIFTEGVFRDVSTDSCLPL